VPKPVAVLAIEVTWPAIWEAEGTKLVTTSWLFVSFGEMERSRGYRGIIKNYAH
jgi:hypothetical protein